ncbi:hypothetical protein DVH24_024449 [Malus domestica]|uniref:Retrotransposon Copia-like N-terminal domain-containing protein n=1 Tax=Malus domestica TaxID=3750 RepID=A0A498JII3_MALDO|nr:hypothetical protein DVH24_024449 [Malus domestica]
MMQIRTHLFNNHHRKIKTIDLSSSYYVHHSDNPHHINPGHMIVSEKLNGPNYSSWSKSIIHALTTKNKIGLWFNSAPHSNKSTKRI